MKIFLSHAITNKGLITKLKKRLEPLGFTLLIAEHEVSAEVTITAKIERMIHECDFALILLTRQGFNSKFVHQEIGYIHSLKKPYLVIVSKGLEKKVTGFPFGRDLLVLNMKDPQPTLDHLERTLLAHWHKLYAAYQQAQLRQLAVRQQQQMLAKMKALEQENTKEARNAALILGGILLVAVLAGK